MGNGAPHANLAAVHSGTAGEWLIPTLKGLSDSCEPDKVVLKKTAAATFHSHRSYGPYCEPSSYSMRHEVGAFSGYRDIS